jgi:hypothetical protein
VKRWLFGKSDVRSIVQPTTSLRSVKRGGRDVALAGVGFIAKISGRFAAWLRVKNSRAKG